MPATLYGRSKRRRPSRRRWMSGSRFWRECRKWTSVIGAGGFMPIWTRILRNCLAQMTASPFPVARVHKTLWRGCIQRWPKLLSAAARLSSCRMVLLFRYGCANCSVHRFRWPGRINATATKTQPSLNFSSKVLTRKVFTGNSCNWLLHNIWTAQHQPPRGEKRSTSAVLDPSAVLPLVRRLEPHIVRIGGSFIPSGLKDAGGLGFGRVFG